MVHWLKGKIILAIIIVIALIALGYCFFYFDVNKGISELASIKASHGLQGFELPSNESGLLALKNELQAFQNKLLERTDSKEFTVLINYVGAELKLIDAEQKIILANTKLSEENMKTCNKEELDQGSFLINQAISLEKDALALLSGIQASANYQKIQGITPEQVEGMISSNNSRLQGIQSLQKIYC